MIATWQSRYPQEREPVTEQPVEWHDDKPSETACNMAVQTQDGDLDQFGRPLRQGS